MATPGQVVAALGALQGFPDRATITVCDRLLAEAGLRTKGGRGSSAAKMTARDMARVLAATLAAVRPKDSVAVVKFLERPRWEPLGHRNDFAVLKREVPELAALAPDHSFIDAIEALIIAAANDTFAKLAIMSARRPIILVSVTIESKPIGRIEYGTEAATPWARAVRKHQQRKLPEMRHGDLVPASDAELIKALQDYLPDDFAALDLSDRRTGTMTGFRQIDTGVFLALGALLAAGERVRTAADAQKKKNKAARRKKRA